MHFATGKHHHLTLLTLVDIRQEKGELLGRIVEDIHRKIRKVVIANKRP